MQTILVLYITTAVVLSTLILMQGQGGGLGSAFGGSGSYHTRRGLEKVMFSGTVFLTAVFTLLSLVVLL